MEGTISTTLVLPRSNACVGHMSFMNVLLMRWHNLVGQTVSQLNLYLVNWICFFVVIFLLILSSAAYLARCNIHLVNETSYSSLHIGSTFVHVDFSYILFLFNFVPIRNTSCFNITKWKCQTFLVIKSDERIGDTSSSNSFWCFSSAVSVGLFGKDM